MNAQILCISLCCPAETEMWIQLPCHLYAPQGVDLGGGGSFSQRNETLVALSLIEAIQVCSALTCSEWGKGSNWDLFSNQYLFQKHEKNSLSFTMGMMIYS